MKIFSFCKKYLLQYKLMLIIYIVMSLLEQSTIILTPYYAGNFVDELVSQKSINAIYTYILIIGIVFIIKIGLGYVTSRLYVKLHINMSYELNRDIIFHIQNMSLSYFNKHDVVYLSQIINSDTNGLIVFCLTIIQNATINIVLLIVPFIIIANMNFNISLIMIIFLLVYTFFYFVLRKPVYKNNFKLKESQVKYFSGFFEQLKYIKLIKIHSIEKIIHKRLEERYANLSADALKNQKTTYLFSSSDAIISMIAQFSLYFLGGIQILSGSFTVGMFIIFANYFNLMLSSLRYFFSITKTFLDALVSYERMLNITKEPVETIGNKILTHINEIEINNLSFSYDNNTFYDFTDIIFEKGKIYGLKGINGSGKSTLCNLIIGLYIDDKKGIIKYNDVDIRCVDMKYAREHFIGVSMQEPVLINDTIKYNVFFTNSIDNRDDIDRLKYLITLLNMDDYINSLDKEMDFVVNEKNSNLSGGEKQKISILTVLMKDPEVMIFDEPSSALDSTSATNLINYLEKIKEDKIIIIITHDSYLQKKCDYIYEFEHEVLSTNEIL